MQFETDSKPNTYETSGQELRINFNVVEVEREEMNGAKRKVYRGEQVVVHTRATTQQIIETLIASKYTTGAEIALSRKDDTDTDKVAYMTFVAQAKSLASGYQNPVPKVGQ
jgi:hypothetical protein